MKMLLDLGSDDSAFLVDALFEKMKREKMVVPEAGRVDPYTAKEVMASTGVSVSTLDRLTESGVLVRVGILAKRIYTAASVEAWYLGKGGADE